MGKLFGTDGVRGIANKELTPKLAYDLGRAGAYSLSKGKEKPLIVIGKDTRISGDMLESALISGILSVGGNVIKLGVIPTPAVAYLVKKYNATCGVVITASHNTFEYNGIKFFNSEGYKLSDAIENEIEDILLGKEEIKSNPLGEKLGRILPSCDAINDYKNHVVSTADYRLDGKTICLDTANGASYEVAKLVYEELGAKVIQMGNTPNGININDNCGSTHPEGLCELVKKEHAFLGLSFDGDADRLIAVDDLGREVVGDKTIAIIAEMLKKEGNLSSNIVTTTEMTNLGFFNRMKELDISVMTTDVGDRYVLESMLKTGSNIGGEQSGHIIFRDKATTGDGLISSIQLVRSVLRLEKPLSEISDSIRIYPQVLVNAKVSKVGKKLFNDDLEISTEIKNLKEKLFGIGKVLIRPSGTEPYIRVMLEGDDTAELTKLAKEMAKKLEIKYPYVD